MLFLEVARQGALNLTTISYSEIDADVQRILDSSTGTFRDDFRNRSQPFIDIVKQARSKSGCTITEVGLESVHPLKIGIEHGTCAAAALTGSEALRSSGPRRGQRTWRLRVLR